jgi:hypothetical protein
LVAVEEKSDKEEVVDGMVLEEQVIGNSETELPPKSQDTESGIKMGLKRKGKVMMKMKMKMKMKMYKELIT